MQRRKFIRQIGIGAAGGLMAGCMGSQQSAECSNEISDKQQIEWKMVTTWPKNFPGLGTAAELLAETVASMSGGRMHIKVYGANELVPPLQVFDAVVNGTAEMGHGSAYYWKGKNPAFQFFSTVPFGMTATEMNAWLIYGDGLELWREAYQQFGVIPFPAGNSGVQMGGWFNKEINRLEDLQGLKMRIPGLGGEVLRRAGGTPVSIPGSDLFVSLQKGVIDATEWVGPYNDLAFGLYKAAKYYYYPGWHEPGTTMECVVSKTAFDALPADLQAIIEGATRIVNQSMLLEYTQRNNDALVALVQEHGVEVRRFPDDVIKELRQLSRQVVSELAGESEQAQKIYNSYYEFLRKSSSWYDISELAYLNLRQS